MLRAQAWYLTRIWIEITPLRIYWWQHDRLDQEPRSWVAPGEHTAEDLGPAAARALAGALAAR
ncbi:MAG: hypothetical protein M3124_09530 [Actinomycetota bacterium]|nr:hypothetical protein [Actinomycetota bacterium]